MKKGNYRAYNMMKHNGKVVSKRYLSDYSDPGESLASFKARIIKSNKRWTKQTGGQKEIILVEIKDVTKKPTRKPQRSQPRAMGGFGGFGGSGIKW